MRFIVVGGLAGSIWGSPVATFDVDVFAPMTDENLERIHRAMQGINARFRMRPDKLPLFEDPARLHGFRNLNFDTDLGRLDILGELTGVGTYEEVEAMSVSMKLDDIDLKVIDLDTLILAKQAAGRDKDRYAVVHLEAIRRLRQQSPPDQSH
ncbi:MAG: hypothetical protein ACHRHE_00040 [Tepidisphaerales bacterium]